MEGSNPDRDEMHEIIHQLEYGMEFRSAKSLVGERLTTGNEQVLPNWAKDVTVPKLLKKLGGK